MAGGGRPISVLNVAEKPSVAKAVTEILSRGAFRVREGQSRYNKIFEFEYTIRGQRCNMHFTSVLGHLMELAFDDRYRKWHSCDPVVLYDAPVIKRVAEDKSELKDTLEIEARKCEWLVLWLDCDREGENIAFEVVEVCTSANPHLDVWRARFSALIERELRDSVERLVRPNQLLSDAADVRQEIDLRSGASFTRFQTLLLRDAFHLDFATDDRNIIMSYGPCQFPTLGFIVERYWEIQSHEAEEFWSINCTHNSDEGTATFSWMRGHMFDYTLAVIVYEMCVEEPTATVTNVKQQEKMKYPPYPLSTIELEKRASRYFRMSSERTMKVAEDLYQSGFISYPRTETDCFSARTELRAMVEEQQGHPEWGPYAQRLLNPEEGLWRNPGNGGHDDKAHPPIHPTRFSGGESGWSQDHYKVYELVVRHFLACVSQPAIGAETTVEIDIAGESFSASGRVILQKNYLDVYRFESWGDSLLPAYNFGQQFIPTTLTLDSGVTRPPPLLSEADLLTCMDKAGIGTDATMHEHIKKLLDRSYATKDTNTRLSPTNLGEALIMGYDDMGKYELWKPDLRAKMECDMKEVSLGTKTKAEVLETCLETLKAWFIDARLNKVKLFEAMGVFFDRSGSDEQQGIGEKVRQCGVCHESDMVLRSKPDGSFMVGCLGYPQCRNVVWLPGSIDEARVTSDVCNICNQGQIFKIQFKFRRLEIPPSYSVDHLGCIGGCDDILKELIDICGTRSRNSASVSGRGRGAPMSANSNQQGRGRGGTTSSSTSQQGRGRGGTASSSARQQGNSRQMACVFCRQHGHSSAECPSQASRSRTESRGMNQQNGESSMPCDSCGNSCPLRTANTANNRGRKFFSCQGCNFFVWEDDLNNNSSNRNGRRSAPRRGPSSSSSNTRGRGRGARGGQASGTMFVSATGEPTSDRRCYSCGDPSHFANVCPNRGM